MAKTQSKHTTITTPARTLALGLGLASAGIGCYAAWEFASKTDGGYLQFAAPIVALAAAVLPAIAERCWQARQRLKALALWAVWLPAAAVVFYTAAERVHLAKAGAEQERAALRSVVTRAETALAIARGDAAAATKAADKVRGVVKCNARCLSIRETETAALGRVAAAESALAKSEGKAVTESAMKMPIWLLPLALDFVGFVCMWAGLGASPVRPATVVKRKRKTGTKAKRPVAPVRLRVAAANDR
jgi:hypothetical protein